VLRPIVHVADLPGRQALPSANTDRLLAPSLATVLSILFVFQRIH